MPRESHLLSTLSVFATLRAAVEAQAQVSLRRRGIDPSEQESESRAVNALADAIKETRLVYTRLRISVATLPDEDDAQVLRYFQDRLLVGRLASLLHGVHQRLLSLYPAVSEEVVEHTRILKALVGEWGESDKHVFYESLPTLADKISRLSAEISAGVLTNRPE